MGTNHRGGEGQTKEEGQFSWKGRTHHRGGGEEGGQILMEGDKGEYSVLRKGGLICISLIFMKLETIIIKQLKIPIFVTFLSNLILQN